MRGREGLHDGTHSRAHAHTSCACSTDFVEPFVEVIPSAAIASTSATVVSLDLLHMAHSEQDFSRRPFRVKITGTGRPVALPVRSDCLENAGKAWGPPAGDAAEHAQSASASAAVSSDITGAATTIHGIALWFDIDFGPDVFDPARCREPPQRVAAAQDVSPASDSGTPPPLEPQASLSANSGAPETGLAAPPLWQRVCLTTSPAAPPTHWVQTLLLFSEPLHVAVGEELSCLLSMQRDLANPREYHFGLEVWREELRLDARAAVGAAAGGPRPPDRCYDYHMK
jgi:hypothetical protein